MTTFESLSADLASGGVESMVVGGLAAAMPGHARTTDDLDIVVAIDRANLDRLSAQISIPAPERQA